MKRNLTDYRIFLLLIYLGLNIYFSIIYLFDDGLLGGDFYNREIHVSSSSIFIAIISIILTYIIYLHFIFNLVDKIKINFTIEFSNFKILHIVFSIITFFYFYCSLYGGNSYNIDFKETGLPYIFLQILTIFEVEKLLYVYIFFGLACVGRIYHINLIIIIIANLISGKSGVLIYLLPLYCINMVLNHNGFSRKKVFTYIILGIIISPIIRILRLFFSFTVSNNQQDITDFISIYKGNSSYLDLYEYFFSASFERFQHVANLSYIVEKGNIISTQLNDYFINNHFTIYLARTFFLHDKPEIYFNSFLANMIDNSKDWSTHSGISGLYYSLGTEGLLYIVIYSLLLIPLIVFSKVFDKKGIIVQYVWVNTLLLFWHGWIGPFYASIYALIIFFIILIIIKTCSKKE